MKKAVSFGKPPFLLPLQAPYHRFQRLSLVESIYLQQFIELCFVHKGPCVATRQTLDQVKTVIRDSLKLGPATDLPDDMPLIGGEFDMDSLDILLVVTNIEKSFGIKIPDRTIAKSVFATITTLADFVETQTK